MSAADSWEAHVQGIVDAFLQTVVVVDDRAFADRELLAADAMDSEDVGAGGRGVVSDLKVPEIPDEHDLDPRAVTDAFAEQGLVCTLLSPRPDEEVEGRLLKTARRADLVVLDWVINRDEGALALELLRGLLTQDDQPGCRRLRTIAVYTGQKDLYGVAQRLQEAVDEAYPDCELEVHDDGLSMTKGPVRVAVFAKEHVPDLPDALDSRRVAFTALPARLRDEFAILTSGLVTTVALAALAALRDDTHRVLQALGPRLDAGFLGHRSALPEPTDAETHAVALVASEVRSVVEDHEVGANVNAEVLGLWLDDPDRVGLVPATLIDAQRPLSREHLNVMLLQGLGTTAGCEAAGGVVVAPDGATHGKNYFQNKVKLRASSAFAASQEEATDSDNEFGHRMGLRTVYSHPPRVLQLGTIVRFSGEYRVCVQPLCDSVRLVEPRAFPFLPLSVVDSGGRTSFIVRDVEEAKWVRLQLTSNPRDLVMVPFDPDDRSSVVAEDEDVGRHFFSDQSGERHYWVGALKGELAQRVAVDLAQQFARVGVDEAELVRLSRG